MLKGECNFLREEIAKITEKCCVFFNKAGYICIVYNLIGLHSHFTEHDPVSCIFFFNCI